MALLSYQEKDTLVHKLSGVTKLIFFILWSVVSMITYDTRVLAAMLVISTVLYKITQIEWREIKGIFTVILFFLVINLLAIYIFSPYEGCKIYNSKTVIWQISKHYALTGEQLFYEFNVLLKYLVVVPSVFIFLMTTNPSEFAASLNKVGVNYKFGYSLAIALRYIPDVQADFNQIKLASQARGIEMSKKASLIQRIKNTMPILFPLIFSSMDRIDVVSNAMELRGFGKNKKRTWYSAKPFKRNDYIVIGITVLFSFIALIITFLNGNRFYNPFN